MNSALAPAPLAIDQFALATVYTGTDEQVLDAGVVFTSELPGHPGCPRLGRYEFKRFGRRVTVWRIGLGRVQVTVNATDEERATHRAEEMRASTDVGSRAFVAGVLQPVEL